jgi:hypothetical protein
MFYFYKIVHSGICNYYAKSIVLEDSFSFIIQLFFLQYNYGALYLNMFSYNNRVIKLNYVNILTAYFKKNDQIIFLNYFKCLNNLRRSIGGNFYLIDLSVKGNYFFYLLLSNYYLLTTKVLKYRFFSKSKKKSKNKYLSKFITVKNDKKLENFISLHRKFYEVTNTFYNNMYFKKKNNVYAKNSELDNFKENRLYYV